MRRSATLTRSVPLLVAAVLTSLGLAATPAQADTAPANPSLPATVTADPLPTAQMNGVAWAQLVVGNTVFVGGNFSSARPAGAPAGTGETARGNFLAYELSTGALLPFAPSFNGQVKDLAVSPDQRTLYVAGQFTAVDGQNRYRVAAFDIATGALTPFRPTVNAGVLGIGVTSTTVFIGGTFTNVNGVARTNVAALDVGGTGTAASAVQPLAASISSGSVQALTVAPDGASIVIGGNFPSVNGSSNPGYGLARLAADTGALLPLPVNNDARNAGTNAAIVSLESDGTNFYGSGYHFGKAGNIEGSFAADWAAGATVWVEDCHGDTYSAFPAGGVVYSASHKHYCGNGGGFPQTEPWTYKRGTATTKTPEGVNTPDIYGYPHHPGTPAPAILNWYPDINAGTFTGKDQGPWTVSGNDQYVVYGGEFTRVGGVPQQGLVRFAVSEIAPDLQGPALQGAQYPLVATSDAAGQVQLSWRTNHDPDNETLTYRLYRSTQTSAPVLQEAVTTPFWQPRAMTFLDTGRPPGAAERYRLVVSDPFGNQASSDWVTVAVATSGTASPYRQAVLDDRPSVYWRLGESSGSTLRDTTGFYDATSASGVTRGVAGAIADDSSTAMTFNGSTSGYASGTAADNAPDSFTVETWIRTTTNRGGKLVGYGNRSSGTSTAADRHLYMDNLGRIHFGIQTSTLQTVNGTAALNNGAWHHVVGTYEAGTMRLYVNGVRVAQRSDIAYERSYWGYWRIGGDRLANWPSRPTSDYLAGTLDEVAIYTYALPESAITKHYVAATTGAVNRAPAASFTAVPSNLSVAVDASASSDTDGTVVSYAWAFGDGGTASGVTAAHEYAAAGTYTVTLTVTDDDGATGTTTRQVVVTEPPAPGAAFAQDTFGRTAVNGWGSAQVGGAWTTTGLPSRFSVDGQRGLHSVLAGATLTTALNGVSSASTDVRVVVSPDKVTTGSGGFVQVQGRRMSDTDYYGARLRLQADGSVQLHTTRGNGSVVTGGVVPGLVYSAGAALQVRLQVDGTSPTTVRAKVWRAGSAEPASWQASMTDTTASLQGAGSVGLQTFMFGSVTNGPVVIAFDDLVAGPVTAEPVNQAPIASFTTASAGLVLQADGSASSDPDGTIASYAWSFGDGSTASGPTASHTYAAGGTYTVALTVTDDDGATATRTEQVVVIAPTANQPPTAAFSVAPSDLTVQVDGSSSTDPDGTIASWAWEFGDGGTGSGATATHAYAAAGTYTVTLVVTDDKGATGTTTREVTVVAPTAGQPFAQDAFTRTVVGGWGASDLGGAWSTTGTASQFSVDGQRGLHRMAAGATLTTALTGVSSSSTEVRVVVGADKVPTGGGAFVHVQGRRVTATDYYGARLRLQADGSVQLHVTRGNGSPVAGLTLPGLVFSAGDQMHVRLQVDGTGSTVVRAKAWKVGTAEPAAWQASMTDSTASLQTLGSVGLSTYLFGTATNAPVVVSYDDLWVGPVG